MARLFTTPCSEYPTLGCCTPDDESALEEARCKMVDHLVVSSGSFSGLGVQEECLETIERLVVNCGIVEAEPKPFGR